jgi:glucose/mannose-6-phosphate isomerase
MFLDDLDAFNRIDVDHMIGHINALPDQLADAWAHGQMLPLPFTKDGITQVVIAGMGGSAISGELFAALAAETCPVPVMVCRDYDLPACATGAATLVIAMSYSGATEETLSVAQQALERGTKLLAICTGGMLAEIATEAGMPVWIFSYPSPPRAALGWMYGLLLAAMSRIGLADDLAADVAETVEGLRRHRESLRPEQIAAHNPGKRYAGQLVDCIPLIWGAGIMAPVARRWKSQINENAKSSAFFDVLPELDHNTIVGITTPEELFRRHKYQIIQLLAPKYDHPRVAMRHQITLDLLREQGVITDTVKGRGNSRLAEQMSLVQFGDYVSYYLAMAYQIDPTPIGILTRLKEMMAAHAR